MFSKHQKEMLTDAYGRVLVIGGGTGKNFQYYPINVEVTAIDFSPETVKIASLKAGRVQKYKECFRSRLRALKFNTFDTVVTSCVSCSVLDPIQGLKENRRV